MKTAFLAVVALVVPLFFLLTLFISTYHRLVLLSTRVKSAFERLELELKRRDELPAKATPDQTATANGSPKTILPARAAYNESVSAYNQQRKSLSRKPDCRAVEFRTGATIGRRFLKMQLRALPAATLAMKVGTLP